MQDIICNGMNFSQCFEDMWPTTVVNNSRYAPKLKKNHGMFQLMIKNCFKLEDLLRILLFFDGNRDVNDFLKKYDNKPRDKFFAYLSSLVEEIKKDNSIEVQIEFKEKEKFEVNQSLAHQLKSYLTQIIHIRHDELTQSIIPIPSSWVYYHLPKKIF